MNIYDAQQVMMLYPMFAMILLTTVVGLVSFRIRYLAVKNNTLRLDYFQVMESMSDDSVPIAVKQSTRCVNNMFEVPLLFYSVSILFILFDQVGVVSVSLAWLFVIFRCAHAYIFLTYNYVIHRMLSFWLAFLCVLAMWLLLIINTVSATS